jgi:hypothetical protein
VERLGAIESGDIEVSLSDHVVGSPETAQLRYGLVHSKEAAF